MKERIQSIKDTLSRHCHPAEHTIADLNKVVVVVVVVAVVVVVVVVAVDVAVDVAAGVVVGGG